MPTGKPNDAHDFTPLYFQLEQELKRDIEEGRWLVGEVIPSAMKIARNRQVSLGTVQKAIMNLVAAGYLYRVQGKGTFVSGTTINRESLRYYRMRRNFRSKDPYMRIELLGLEPVDGRSPVNRLLKIRNNNRLYEVKRVFLSRGIPVVYTVSYLPCKMFDDFERKAGDGLGKETLYQLIERIYGLPTLYNEELIDVGSCDRELADILDMAPGQPVLQVEMLSYTFKDQPYEYRIGYCRPGEKKLYREIR